MIIKHVVRRLCRTHWRARPSLSQSCLCEAHDRRDHDRSYYVTHEPLDLNERRDRLVDQRVTRIDVLIRVQRDDRALTVTLLI
eukprot:3271774-Rhodomonas_salina.4